MTSQKEDELVREVLEIARARLALRPGRFAVFERELRTSKVTPDSMPQPVGMQPWVILNHVRLTRVFDPLAARQLVTEHVDRWATWYEQAMQPSAVAPMHPIPGTEPAEQVGRKPSQPVARPKSGIETPILAMVFEDLTPNSWSRARWKSHIDKGASPWLLECQARPGKVGGNEPKPALWCPVMVARRLCEGKAGRQPVVTHMELTSRFKKYESLAQWRDEWKAYCDGLPGGPD